MRWRASWHAGYGRAYLTLIQPSLHLSWFGLASLKSATTWRRSPRWSKASNFARHWGASPAVMTADRSSTSEKAGFEIIVDMSRAATAIGQLISNTGEFLKPLSP